MATLEAENSYPSDNITTDKIKSLNVDYIQSEWSKALDRRTTDPEAAITSARTLIETVCKYILDSKNIQYKDGEDLPKLYNLTAKELNLSPSQHDEKIFKEILSGCFSIVKSLGAIRNKYSDSHGKNTKYIKPSPRHAELSVNLAGAMSIFLLETLEFQNKSPNNII